MRIGLREILWLILINIGLLQDALALRITGFKYFDELITFIMLLYLIFHIKRLKKKHILIILLLVLFVILGLIGNLTSGVRRPTLAIALDIFYFSKLFICFIGASMYFENRRISNVLPVVVSEIHIFVFIGVILAILSQFINVGMTHGYRYGFKSFYYIYSSPGMLSQYCIIFLVILTIDLVGNKKKAWKIGHIIMLFMLWISTGRTRGIAVILIWFFLTVIFSSKNLSDSTPATVKSRLNKLKQIMNPKYIIPAGAAVLIVGWDQIQYYLGAESTTARSILLRSGLSVMKAFFPFGAGFATFGTEMAARYYSPLYYQYRVNTHWALVEGGGELTDCFWPAVGAEFGIFGIVVMGMLIWNFSKELLVYSSENKYSLIACITYITYLLISSTATSIYTAYTTTVFVTIILGLIEKKRIFYYSV